MIELPDHPPHGTGHTAQLYEEVRRMSKDDALQIIMDAADNWARELVDYIAPASEDWNDQESADNQRENANQIWEAIKVLGGRDA
jgi:hypothetical protein